jgi:hypothetical protein
MEPTFTNRNLCALFPGLRRCCEWRVSGFVHSLRHCDPAGVHTARTIGGIAAALFLPLMSGGLYAIFRFIEVVLHVVRS